MGLISSSSKSSQSINLILFFLNECEDNCIEWNEEVFYFIYKTSLLLMIKA